ncbi:MAG: hypothetical protein ACYC4L_16700 [Chloroflexota bacterium]
MEVRIESGTQCIESARRGVAWLLNQQNSDGSWKHLPEPPVDAYYRASWTLGLMGEAAAAERSLNFLKQRFLTPEGDLTLRENAWYHYVHYPYQNGIVVAGAHRLGRFDVAVPALRFMLGLQDPQHGGFYMVLPGQGEKAPSNTKSTAMCGIACLMAGQMEAALRAGDWLNGLVEMQPAPAERFYTTTKPDGSLRTDYGEAEARWHMVEIKEPSQCWYAIGLPFAFAVMLYEATGEKRYADLAQWFHELHLRCVNPWDGSSSGKGAWACSMLYRLTGEQRYREAALHVAGNFVVRQTPEGWFKGWAYVPPAPGADPTLLTVRQFESTLEFGQWLGLIGENLLARDSE